MTIYSSNEAYSRIDIHPINPLALVILLLPLIFFKIRGKSAGWLMCFSLFFLYAWAVCAYTLCPLPINPKVIGWLGCTDSWRLSLNLVPTFFSRDFDVRSEQVYGNFLLGVPFGVGLPFVVAPKNSTPRRVLALALGFAAGLELAQLLIGFIVCPYRSIDIDDMIFVFTGALIGHGALWGAARAYRYIGWNDGGRLPIWNHVHAVLLNVASSGAGPHPVGRAHPG